MKKQTALSGALSTVTREVKAAFSEEMIEVNLHVVEKGPQTDWLRTQVK